MEDTKVKIGCGSCLYAGTHEACGSYDKGTHCLGSLKEVDENNGEYLYKHYKYGTTSECIDRLREFEKDGRRNIVIGGYGEAEVNTQWTPQEALDSLVNVSEACGYLTQRGEWTDFKKEIFVYVDAGKFRLTYCWDKLKQIDKITEQNIYYFD